MTTGLLADAQQLGGAVERVAVGGRQPQRVGQRGGRVGVHLGLHEHLVEREVEEGRAGRRRERRRAAPRRRAPGMSAVVCAVRASLVTGATNGTWSISWSEPCPQRNAGARPPSTSIGEPFCSADAMPLMPLVTPGPAVSARHAGLAGGLGPALGGERGRLLVADVDDVDALLAAAVVDREQVAAREREQLRHAVRLEALRDQPAAVQPRALLGLRAGAT